MMSTADQVLMSGSFGAGKSRVGCEKGYFLNMQYPGNRGLIIRKSLKDVKASTINQTLIPEVIPESHIKVHTKRDNKIEHYTGTVDPEGEPVTSEVHYYGLESGRKKRDDDLPEKIGSTSWGWIFVDEGTEISKGDWNQLYGRLRYDGKRQNGRHYKVPFRQIFTATNPASPGHWMYEHFKPEDPGEGKGETFMMTLSDNVHLPQDYVENLETNLSGMYYERYVKGRWVGAEGMVYEEFDPKKHLITDTDDLPAAEEWQIHGTDEYPDGEKSIFVTPPADWRVYRTIDFGYRNPFVCQWWAASPDDVLVMFRELYVTEELVEDLAPRIKMLSPDGRKISGTFCDHDVEANEVLRRRGVDTQNAKKDIEQGIQAVKSKLKPNDRGEPELFFLANARCHEADTQLKLREDPLRTVEEIYEYSWDEEEEVPEEGNDHGLDAMRYLVHTLFGGPMLSIDQMEEYEEIINSTEW